jgi:hypothetical protein
MHPMPSRSSQLVAAIAPCLQEVGEALVNLLHKRQYHAIPQEKVAVLCMLRAV